MTAGRDPDGRDVASGAAPSDADAKADTQRADHECSYTVCGICFHKIVGRLRDELARVEMDWARRYDDAVQPLQRRCAELVTALAGRAPASERSEATADGRELIARLLTAIARFEKVDREWDAETNVMPLACEHPKEMHDGWQNEFDASRIDLFREASEVAAALASPRGEPGVSHDVERRDADAWDYTPADMEPMIIHAWRDEVGDIIVQAKGGNWEGCTTDGETLAEAFKNFGEVAALYAATRDGEARGNDPKAKAWLARFDAKSAPAPDEARRGGDHDR
jgi:hypothetical protein